MFYYSFYVLLSLLSYVCWFLQVDVLYSANVCLCVSVVAVHWSVKSVRLWYSHGSCLNEETALLNILQSFMVLQKAPKVMWQTEGLEAWSPRTDLTGCMSQECSSPSDRNTEGWLCWPLFTCRGKDYISGQKVEIRKQVLRTCHGVKLLCCFVKDMYCHWVLIRVIETAGTSPNAIKNRPYIYISYIRSGSPSCLASVVKI